VDRTLNEPGTILRQVFNDDIAAPVSKESIERRLFRVLGYVVADLDDAAVPAAQQLDFVTGGVLEEEPI
jgi:hypothetical protein